MAQHNISDLKALVVDDHLIVRADIERHLKDLGVSLVDQAANADEASAKMAGGKYDVIFLDWNMPGRSGFHLLQQCRQEDEYNSVAFVIVSAESEERYIIEALKAGATSYIVKPVAETILKDHVHRVVAWINQRRAEETQKTA